jgi:hypothetical protein
MNMESKLVSLVSNRDYVAIVKLQSELTLERMKLDKFFSMFLDKFEKKMNPDTTNTPVWNLYKTKMKEYESIQRGITLTTYYLKRDSYV